MNYPVLVFVSLMFKQKTVLLLTSFAHFFLGILPQLFTSGGTFPL